MSLSHRQIYRFGEFVLQPAARSLLRCNEKIALSPKSFEVLVCLVENAGRVVLKEELLKSVWPASFVEESNLTQHIFWLRKALADKAEYIVTIPGRGYQFTASVEAIADREWLTQTEVQSWTETSVRGERTTERTRVILEETTTVAPQMPGRRRMVLAAAAGLLLCVAAIAGLWSYRHRAVRGDHHQVVLADFENSTGDPDFDHALKTLLVIDLNQSPFFQVASDADSRKVLKLMNRPPEADFTPAVAREVCERLNDQVVLSGLIARFGQKYLVTLTATDCSGGSDLVQTKAVARDRDAVIKAVDTVAADMRKRLGEPLKSLPVAAHPLVLAHTFSLDALRAYSQARASHVRLKFSAAVPLYKRAIELDPNFADAYAQLANCYNNLGEALLGRDAMARAYDLRDQAEGSDRLRITSMYEYWKTGDRHAAIKTYQAWTSLYPRQTAPWVLLGEFQESVGRMDLAVDALQHAVALNPGSSDAAMSLADAQRYAGRLDDARATCHAALNRGLEAVDLHHTLLIVAWLQHDTASFDAQLGWFRETATEEDRVSVEADLEASRGKIHSAVARWLQVAALQQQDGLQEAALEGFADVPRLEAEVGLLPEARRHFERFKPATPLTGASLTAVIVAAAELGEVELAQKKLAYMRENGKHDSDVQEIFAPEGDAAVDLAQGKAEQAIAALQSTAPYELTDPTVPSLRGRALLAAHRPEMAQSEFRTMIERPWISAISANVALAHLSLGRALAMQGNRPSARQEYEAFFALWKDADADLPVLSQAHREYAALKDARPV